MFSNVVHCRKIIVVIKSVFGSYNAKLCLPTEPNNYLDSSDGFTGWVLLN